MCGCSPHRKAMFRVVQRPRHSNRLLGSHSLLCSLPPEILSSALLMGQMACRYQDLGDANESLRLPFEVAITHVCSHLRYIALHTGQLWRCLKITSATSVDMVAAYLSRSQRHGLDLFIDIAASSIAALEIILPHANRITKLVLRCSHGHESFVPILEQLCIRGTPSVRHFSATIEETPCIDFSSALRNVTRLSFVRLRGLAVSLLRPPLNMVETFHLDQTQANPIRYTAFRDMVTASPFLANLSVFGDIIDVRFDAWPGSANAIEMPSLRSLRICGIDGLIYSGLLLSINASRLETLVLKNVHEFDLERFCRSQHVLKFPSLRHLSFFDFDLSDRVYADIFRVFPSVTSFTSSQSFPYSPTILRLLAGRTQNPMEIPWPELHTLSLILNPEDASLIMGAVQTRKAIGRPLAKLRLGASNEFSLGRQLEHVQNGISVERFIAFDRWIAECMDSEDILFD